MSKLNQRTRFIVLIFYGLFLLAISKITFGTYLPPSNEKGLWFYAGLASILMGYILTNPFYTPPADSFSNGVAALISILAVNILDKSQYTEFDFLFWKIILIYSISILLLSGLAIVSKDSRKIFFIKLGKTFTLISSSLGSPKTIFSVLYIFSLIVFHRTNINEFINISLSWIIIIGIHPFESVALLFIKISNLWKERIIGEAKIGEVIGHQFPNLITIKNNPEEKISFGTPLLVFNEEGDYSTCLALDYMGFSEGRWLRALEVKLDSLPINKTLKNLSTLGAYRIKPEKINEIFKDDNLWINRNHLIGIVAQESDTTILNIDLIKSDIDLEVGRLVKVYLGGLPVIYQLIDGITKEEILKQKSTRGYVNAFARKIGTWDQSDRKFHTVKWVPEPNSPVYLIDSEEDAGCKEAIGHFPKTNYHVSISNLNELVTHNTAILGILGVGKSYLSFELIERMISANIKVICIDITNQYEVELDSFLDKDIATLINTEISTVGPSGKNNVQLNVEEGGSIQAVQSVMERSLRVFLDPAHQQKLLIINPNLFEVWRQDSRPYNNTASMKSLSLVEITRIITESALLILQDFGITDEAKCCIVFEEAHSLIPEWNSTVEEGDKTASNAIAKAILQGRKYGLGCHVITQRTANVTKSILNQCNTVFSMRIFDSTGMDFLQNFIGKDYTSILSSLEDRHAVFFGRASSCKDPVLIRLNDRDDFIKSFREEKIETGSGSLNASNESKDISDNLEELPF